MTVRPRLAVIAAIALFATASSLLGQGPEGRAERAKQILPNQPRAYEDRDINDGARGWFGVWTLNLDKSVYNPGPAPYKRATMKVERVDDKVRFSYASCTCAAAFSISNGRAILTATTTWFRESTNI